VFSVCYDHVCWFNKLTCVSFVCVLGVCVGFMRVWCMSAFWVRVLSACICVFVVCVLLFGVCITIGAFLLALSALHSYVVLVFLGCALRVFDFYCMLCVLHVCTCFVRAYVCVVLYLRSTCCVFCVCLSVVCVLCGCECVCLCAV